MKKKKETPHETVGKALKRIRESFSYSKADVAKYFNDDVLRIEAWESDLAEPTITESLVLSRLYGVSVDEIFAAIDVKSEIPQKYIDDFEWETYVNRLTDRWYE